MVYTLLSAVTIVKAATVVYLVVLYVQTVLPSRQQL